MRYIMYTLARIYIFLLGTEHKELIILLLNVHYIEENIFWARGLEPPSLSNIPINGYSVLYRLSYAQSMSVRRVGVRVCLGPPFFRKKWFPPSPLF